MAEPIRHVSGLALAFTLSRFTVSVVIYRRKLAYGG